jgi:hypothetical protein
VVTEPHLPWNILHIIKRRNAEWTGLLKGVIEGRMEVMRHNEDDVSGYRMTFRRENNELETGNASSHSPENSLW